MAKQYIAIGLDADRDVVATDLGHDTADSAKERLEGTFDNVVIYHVIEIDTPDRPIVKVKTTKLTIG